MNWYGGGFTTIINYASYQQGAEELNAITTESSQNILTENSLTLLVE